MIYSEILKEIKLYIWQKINKLCLNSSETGFQSRTAFKVIGDYFLPSISEYRSTYLNIKFALGNGANIRNLGMLSA